MLTQTTYRRHPSLTREWERYNHSVPGGQHAGDYITGLAVMLTLDVRWSRVSVVFFVCLFVCFWGEGGLILDLCLNSKLHNMLHRGKPTKSKTTRVGETDWKNDTQSGRQADGRTGWRSIAMARSKVQSGHSQPIHMDLLWMQWALSHI